MSSDPALEPVIEAYLQGNTVRVAHLVEFCFKTQARRVSNLSFQITAGGHTWFPLNKLGTIEGIDDPGDLEAAEMRFSVSGVDERFAALFTMAAAEAREEYVGRHVKVYLCFFDDDWQQLGDLVARAFGIMDSIGMSSHPVQDGEGTSYTQRVISITAQNFLYGRSSPPASNYSHRDQQLRSPGDRGLEFVAELVEKNIPFPW